MAKNRQLIVALICIITVLVIVYARLRRKRDRFSPANSAAPRIATTGRAVQNSLAAIVSLGENFRSLAPPPVFPAKQVYPVIINVCNQFAASVATVRQMPQTEQNYYNMYMQLSSSDSRYLANAAMFESVGEALHQNIARQEETCPPWEPVPQASEGVNDRNGTGGNILIQMAAEMRRLTVHLHALGYALGAE